MATSFLTREGYQKLQEELEFLRTTKRQEIANRCMSHGRRRADENADTRLPKTSRHLLKAGSRAEILLATARVIGNGDRAEAVQIGSRVTIQEEGARWKCILSSARRKPTRAPAHFQRVAAGQIPAQS